MISKLKLLLPFVFCSIFISAQQNEYTVLTKSGDVFLLSSSSNDLLELKLGKKISSNERILLKPEGYLVLVDSSLRSAEITAEGIYNLASIDKAFSIKRNSITEKITKFILNEMSTSSKRSSEMKTLGAVVRKPIASVEAAVPSVGKIIDSVYKFKWHPLLDGTSYIFRLFNEIGKTIYMVETQDTFINLNLIKFNPKYESNYYWTVFDKSQLDLQVDSISFSLLSPNQIAVLKSNLLNIEKDILLENSSYNNLLIARYLESLELNEAAIKYFEKCIELQPEVEFYWTEYISFLVELDLMYEALEKWNISPFNNHKFRNKD